jgi:hypothetical protein
MRCGDVDRNPGLRHLSHLGFPDYTHISQEDPTVQIQIISRSRAKCYSENPDLDPDPDQAGKETRKEATGLHPYSPIPQRTANVTNAVKSDAENWVEFSTGVANYWVVLVAVRTSSTKWIRMDRDYLIRNHFLVEDIPGCVPGPNILLSGDVERNPGPLRLITRPGGSTTRPGDQSPSSGEPPHIMAEEFSYRLKDVPTPSPGSNLVAVKIHPDMIFLMGEDHVHCVAEDIVGTSLPYETVFDQEYCHDAIRHRVNEYGLGATIISYITGRLNYVWDTAPSTGQYSTYGRTQTVSWDITEATPMYVL